MDVEDRQVRQIVQSIGSRLHVLSVLAASVGVPIWFMGTVLILSTGREWVMWYWFPIVLLLALPGLVMEARLPEKIARNRSDVDWSARRTIRARIYSNQCLRASLIEIGAPQLLWLAGPVRHIIFAVSIAVVTWFSLSST